MSNATPFPLKSLTIGLMTVFLTTYASTAQAEEDSATATATQVYRAQTSALAQLQGQAKTSVASDTGIKTTDDPGVPANPDDSKYSDQYVIDYFTNTGVPPGTPLLAMPRKMRRSAGRFGEFRWRSGNPGFHAGLDMTPQGGYAMRAPGEGTIAATSSGSAAGNTVTVLRPNGDKYKFLHMRDSISRSHPKNSKVNLGDPLGTVGGSGGDYAVHLHFNYILPNNNPSRWRHFHLSNESKRLGSSRFSLHSGTYTWKGSSGYTTDPTPYLAEDLPVKPDGYSKFLGSTIRQQFNTLYNTKLPLGPGATASLRPIPKLPLTDQGFDWTPEMVAAAKTSLVNGAQLADWSGYSGAFASNGMSYQALASFISSTDGAQFGTLPQPAEPVSLETMTPREIIEFVSSKRYGNAGWEKAMMNLSSKGLLTEYTMMNATENYLNQQNQRLRNRVEMLMAGITQARLFEFNKKIEALQVTAEAQSVPSILDLELEDLGYSNGGGYPGGAVDVSNLPMELNALIDAMMDAISEGEGDWNAYNTGQGNKKYPPVCDIKGYFNTSQARNNGTPLITTMTIREIWQSAAGVSNCKVSRKFTAGKYQFTYYTLAGKNSFGSGGFIAQFPQYADSVFTEELQQLAAKEYLVMGGRKRPDLTKFLKGGDVSVTEAMYELSKEWASVAVPANLPMKGGRRISDGTKSFYESRTNHANMSSTKKTEAILRKIQEWHRANPGLAQKVLNGEMEDPGVANAQSPASDTTATETTTSLTTDSTN